MTKLTGKKTETGAATARAFNTGVIQQVADECERTLTHYADAMAPEERDAFAFAMNGLRGVLAIQLDEAAEDAARREGYRLDDRGRIVNPGKFEHEHARTLDMWGRVLDGDCEASVSFNDGASECVHKDAAGRWFLITEEAQGFVTARQLSDRDAAGECMRINGLATLLAWRDDPDSLNGVVISDPSELDSLSVEWMEAICVNDHGNTTLYVGVETGEGVAWAEAASLV